MVQFLCIALFNCGPITAGISYQPPPQCKVHFAPSWFAQSAHIYVPMGEFGLEENVFQDNNILRKLKYSDFSFLSIQICKSTCQSL